MRPPRRCVVFLLGVLAALFLVGGQLVATAAEETSSPDATESPTAAETAGTGGGEEGGAPAGAEEAGEEGGEEGERTKIEPPLSFSDPQDILGWVILGGVAIAAAAAGRNVLQQMRGERPRADGTWRPR